MKKIKLFAVLLIVLFNVSCGPSDEKTQQITDSITDQSIKKAEDELIKALGNVDSLMEKSDSIQKAK